MGLDKKQINILDGIKNTFLDLFYTLALTPILFFIWFVIIMGDIKRELYKRF